MLRLTGPFSDVRLDVRRCAENTCNEFADFFWCCFINAMDYNVCYG